jgi:hypothetical protein
LSESKEDDVSPQEFPASSELMEMLLLAKCILQLKKYTKNGDSLPQITQKRGEKNIVTINISKINE